MGQNVLSKKLKIRNVYKVDIRNERIVLKKIRTYNKSFVYSLKKHN